MDTETVYREKLVIPQNIDTGFQAHSLLSEISTQLAGTRSNVIYLDFSRVDFIASNQFAVLGCILDAYKTEHPEATIYFF